MPTKGNGGTVIKQYRRLPLAGPGEASPTYHAIAGLLECPLDRCCVIVVFRRQNNNFHRIASREPRLCTLKNALKKKRWSHECATVREISTRQRKRLRLWRW